MGRCQITNQVKSRKEKKKHMEKTISKCELLVSCIEKAWRRPNIRLSVEVVTPFNFKPVTSLFQPWSTRLQSYKSSLEKEKRKKKKGNT